MNIRLLVIFFLGICCEAADSKKYLVDVQPLSDPNHVELQHPPRVWNPIASHRILGGGDRFVVAEYLIHDDVPPNQSYYWSVVAILLEGEHRQNVKNAMVSQLDDDRAGILWMKSLSSLEFTEVMFIEGVGSFQSFEWSLDEMVATVKVDSHVVLVDQSGRLFKAGLVTYEDAKKRRTDRPLVDPQEIRAERFMGEVFRERILPELQRSSSQSASCPFCRETKYMIPMQDGGQACIACATQDVWEQNDYGSPKDTDVSCMENLAREHFSLGTGSGTVHRPDFGSGS